MKCLFASLLLVLPAMLAASAEQLIPAGSEMQCMISDKISSKTTNVGDPVLCQMSRVELYGRSTFPYGSYLEGHFQEYKDPGHLVGKGWMELKFDRMVVGNDTVIPIEARVVGTSEKNRVDSEGKIHGTGHAVRDTVEWLIPVLWPIDLINLPRRGPYPVLKPETRLTLRVLDDFGVPTKAEVQSQPELISRFNYAETTPTQAPAPIERYAPPVQAPPVQQAYAPQPTYAPQPGPTVVVVQAPAPAPTVIQQAAPVVVQQQAPRPVVYGYPPPPPYPYRYYPYGYYPY